MKMPRAPWDDARTESIMGNLLRAAVLIAATVVLIGGVIYCTEYLRGKSAAPVSYRVFHGEPAELRSIPKILQHAASGNSRAIMQLGLLLLIATPLLRVAFAIIAFHLEKDRLYTGVSCMVLAVLLYSLLHAT